MHLKLTFPDRISVYETEGDSSQFLTKTQLKLTIDEERQELRLELWSAMFNADKAREGSIVGEFRGSEAGYPVDVFEMSFEEYGDGWQEPTLSEFFSKCGVYYGLTGVELDGVRLWGAVEKERIVDLAQGLADVITI